MICTNFIASGVVLTRTSRIIILWHYNLNKHITLSRGLRRQSDPKSLDYPSSLHPKTALPIRTLSSSTSNWPAVVSSTLPNSSFNEAMRESGRNDIVGKESGESREATREEDSWGGSDSALSTPRDNEGILEMPSGMLGESLERFGDPLQHACGCPSGFTSPPARVTATSGSLLELGCRVSLLSRRAHAKDA